MDFDADAAALLVGLECQLFDAADAIEWASTIMGEVPDALPDLIDLAMQSDDTPRATCVDLLRRLVALPSQAKQSRGVTKRLLATALLLRQRGVPAVAVAQRFAGLAKNLPLDADEAAFCDSLARQPFEAWGAFFRGLDLSDSRLPCLVTLTCVPTLRAMVEAWSRHSPDGDAEVWALARSRMPEVTGDAQTATELLLVDSASRVLAEALEHGGLRELAPVQPMVDAVIAGVSSLDSKRGFTAEVRSPSLDEVLPRTTAGSPRPGSGEWLSQARLYAAHLKTAAVRRKLGMA